MVCSFYMDKRRRFFSNVDFRFKRLQISAKLFKEFGTDAHIFGPIKTRIDKI